jgi:ABC-2 type transport system ATP-binding protein
MIPIEVTNLKKYYGDTKAVDGISFTVSQGEVFALLGPNGAGKTTTIEVLEGLRKRDSGEVKVLGLDPWQNGYKLHQMIGVIPQEFTFFEKTSPREAIVYYSKLFNSQVDPEEILKEVLLEDSADVMFDDLSGGQKRKTGLALSLVNTPELVFLDEPTTGLDPAARRALWEVIRRLKSKGRTIILTTHYLDEAQQLSDRVAIMNHGSIVAHGTADEIIRQHGSGERLEIQGKEELAQYLKSRTGLETEYHNGLVIVPLKRKTDAHLALEAAEQSKMEWGEFRLHRDSLDDVFVTLVAGAMNEQGDVNANNGTKPKKKRRF